ncbi:HlyD family efflux transporter periplasmic adaptor subunit [uncultured Ruminococcus sp.]|uniref:HlyD family efflux transporter periplasmic adaptor subunit n=1 Tax=uncultured Ruminococcus sp. TaxID=165186 RepID=UPI00259949B4|nr:HlyD family efflux transporter periplasmic adaptor subunit [uncultured Ruminococcus sp.]
MKGIIVDLKDISDSREVMESKESPKISWFIYILLAVIITAIIFSCVFRIDEYSRVCGEIKTQTAASSVISTNSCKLKEILVSEGQEVKSGDVLFVLDSDYAESQKALLEENLTDCKSDLDNTLLFKESVEKNENLFKNNADDSKFYYRYEQYKNGVLLTAQEIDNSILSSSLSKEEKENNLVAVKTKISDTNTQIAEYQAMLSCVENNSQYLGGDTIVKSSFDEYYANYNKANLLCEQYGNAYVKTVDTFNEQLSVQWITAEQVENAASAAETAYSVAEEYKKAYLTDLRSQILLLENQLISDSENPDLANALAEYTRLKSAVEQDADFTSADETIQGSYTQYRTQYDALIADYSVKSEEYQNLYSTYVEQSKIVRVTKADIQNALTVYDNATMDVETLKKTFISQVQAAIQSLKNELKTLESNRDSLELSLKNVDDLEEYEKLSSDKLKNEAIITINSEIDSINSNIASIESQLMEIAETIKSCEIKATVDGTVTLINEANTGDIIQAGSSLCSIIPSGSELKVTLYIPESDIAKVEVGQKTEYIIDSIPYTEYGRITGVITSISADSIGDESTGAKYYIGQANLDTTSLSNEAGDVREVRTGMLLEAKTISGSKRVITWLLEKINFID